MVVPVQGQPVGVPEGQIKFTGNEPVRAGVLWHTSVRGTGLCLGGVEGKCPAGCVPGRAVPWLVAALGRPVPTGLCALGKEFMDPSLKGGSGSQ